MESNVESKFRSIAVMGVGVALTVGCAAPVKEQDRTGFISDYSQLKKIGNEAYLYTSPKVASYSTFRIDGPTMLVESSEGGSGQFTQDEIADLKSYFRNQLTEALTENDGYVVVGEPGEGVATIRIGITAVDATLGALNVALTTKITGAGLGGAAMEGEMIDSMTGEQLAAAVQWGSGSRVLRAGFTKSGDARLQIKRWTRILRQRIDVAHSLAAAGDNPGKR